MHKLLAMLPLLWLAACGAELEAKALKREIEHGSFRSINGTDIQKENSSHVLKIFRDSLDVNGSQVDLNYPTDKTWQQDTCHGFAACTYPGNSNYKIYSYWPTLAEQPKGKPASYATMLAHELCHTYYAQTGKNPDGDPNHTHTECFANPDYPKMYGFDTGTEQGIAWLVGQQFVQESE